MNRLAVLVLVVWFFVYVAPPMPDGFWSGLAFLALYCWVYAVLIGRQGR